jgi:hypothetical protein
MRLYIEPTNGFSTQEAESLIHQNLKRLDSDYSDLENMLGSVPLQVSRLEPGAFDRYLQAKRKAGAEMAHLKPPRVNPKESVLELLLDEKKN